jgi:XTP/dITP diphosphohydrolase
MIFVNILSIIIMDTRLTAFKRLLDIMDELREKCPWDKKQTLESLRKLTIEETYELADAIVENDLEELKGEIGDIMLHMVFYSKIAEEKGAFDITDVLNEICDKLVHRHPHIYGDVEVADEEEVKANWEQLKLKEGKTSVLQGVPKSLPAMVKANRIQEKARGVGFDWDNKEQVWAKVQEELDELKVEVDANADINRIEDEMGDVLFSVINYARFIDIDPETALERTNKKFIKRFQFLESKVKEQGKELSKMTLAEMDVLWEEAKNNN